MRNHCRTCNSERKGLTCWKCGSETVEPSLEWEYPELPPLERIRGLAREKGYALAVHGSQERDLDVIAVPWTDNASSLEELLAHLCEGLDAIVAGGIEDKPHGRRAACLQMNGWYKLIDLSVCALGTA